MGASPTNQVRDFWSQLLVRDALFALVAAIGFSLAASQMQFAPQTRGTPLGAAIWSFLIWVPVAWRRVKPVPAAIAVGLVSMAQLAMGYYLLPADLGVLVVVYSVSAYGTRWASRLALLAAVLGSISMAVALVGWSRGEIFVNTSFYDFLVIAVMTSALIVAAWALGLMRRARRETIGALQARAVALEERAQQLELERDQQRIIATQAERARIAREMHDIVAHSLSIIIVQADGGRYAAINDAAAGQAALATISETGRSALKEMRRLLGVLRSDESLPGSPGTAGIMPDDSNASRLELAPLAGTAQTSGANDLDAAGLFPSGLAELFDQARAAGMPLKVITSGVSRTLEPGAALTLQRVCQEALTNVRKHAGPRAKTTVSLTWLPTELQLVIDNSGYPTSGNIPIAGLPATPGYGLIGLQERAALVGGTLTAGPKPEGGWQTKFTMPV